MINFSGPPEEASMTQCLLSDAALDGHTAAFYERVLPDLQEVSQGYRKEFKMWPHVAVALGLMLATQGSGAQESTAPARKHAKPAQGSGAQESEGPARKRTKPALGSSTQESKGNTRGRAKG
jgi:hypothetical protein